MWGQQHVASMFSHGSLRGPANYSHLCVCVSPLENGSGSKPMGSHFGVGALPILEIILVGIGMFTGGTLWVLTHGQMDAIFQCNLCFVERVDGRKKAEEPKEKADVGFRLSNSVNVHVPVCFG